MSQPRRTNADGTYSPIPTMNRQEWDELRGRPLEFPRLGSRQVTVNSQPRVIVRGRQKRTATKGA